MQFQFEKIHELDRIRKQIAVLREHEQLLSAPIVSDFNELGNVYKAFCEITGQDCQGRSWNAVASRKKFIFIAAYIFAPGMLLGECIPKRLRMALAKTLKVNSLSAISNNWSDALFYYKNYRGYKVEMETLTLNVLHKIGISA